MGEQRNPLIKLENVSISRDGRTLLRNLDWEIYPGQHWGIVGPNGSGKSLLMQALQGRLPPSAGRLAYSDRAIQGSFAQVSFEQQSRLIAAEVEQGFFRGFSHSSEQGTTVRQFLEQLLAAHDGSDAPSSLESILAWLDLAHLMDTPLLALSNGEMRKVLIARALRQAPRLLILDEPFDGLDRQARPALAQAIESLATSGVQILLVTHRLAELPAAVTHLLCLKDGAICLAGERNAALEAELEAQLLGGTPGQAPGDPSSRPPAGEGPSPRALPAPPAPRAVRPASPPTVVLKDVTVHYGPKVVLDKLSWTAHRDENWAVVGPNGAGKSTLLRLISADHLQAYANEIYLFGRRRGSGESIWEIKQKIGVLSPEFQIAYRQDLLAVEVVLSGFFDSIGLYRRTRQEQDAQAQAWIELLGLAGLASQHFDRLSYGERRMILLARALVKSPQVLLLDEPTQGLDLANSRRLVDTVSAMSAKTGTQLIYVTHRREELPACITHMLEFKKRPGEPDPDRPYNTEICLISTGTVKAV